jgi:hypothetical protein
MSDTPETNAAWACFKGYTEPLQDVQDLSRKLERERDDYMERCRIALSDRDSWRLRAEQKYAMRRELEELLGVDQKDAYDEQFQKGLDAIKNIIGERDRLRQLLVADSERVDAYLGVCTERDEAREVARLLKSTLDLIKNDQLQS